MDAIIFSAYLMAYMLNGEPFSAIGKAKPDAKGVETRILEVLGPHGATLAECEKFADGQRKRAAVTYKLASYQQLTFDCRPMPLSK